VNSPGFQKLTSEFLPNKIFSMTQTSAASFDQFNMMSNGQEVYIVFSDLNSLLMLVGIDDLGGGYSVQRFEFDLIDVIVSI